MKVRIYLYQYILKSVYSIYEYIKCGIWKYINIWKKYIQIYFYINSRNTNIWSQDIRTNEYKSLDIRILINRIYDNSYIGENNKYMKTKYIHIYVYIWKSVYTNIFITESSYIQIYVYMNNESPDIKYSNIWKNVYINMCIYESPDKRINENIKVWIFEY